MSASISELEEVISRLEVIERKMQNITSLSGAQDLATAQRNMNELRITQNEVVTLSNQMFSILRRMGLPENLSVAMAAMQRLIAMANAVRLAMIALQASNPVGLAIAGLGVASSLISMGDMAVRYG